MNAAATLLPDGRALVAGGSDGSSALSSVEIYDPVNRSWSAAGSMLSNYPAQALLLTDGRVLLSHQVDVDATRPGELFDPVRGNFQALPQGVGPRSVATLLSNGEVLFWESEKGATIYDPSTNSYSPGGGFCWGIAGTWSRLLADGRVLCRAENFV